MPSVSLQVWNDFIRNCPQAHVLQSPAWGELKSHFGWERTWVVRGSLGAQLLFQRVPLDFQVAYLPRGPISAAGDVFGHPDWGAFQQDLDLICKERKAVFLKLEPDCWQDDPGAIPPPAGYKASPHHIQPPRTVVVSLAESEEEMLSRMKSKTRYNIRLAEKRGITTRRITEIEPFYRLLEKTSDRAEFGIHTEAYYQKAFELFQASGECQLFLAEYEGLPLASIMVFIRGERSWYFYGASSDQHREYMPTYLVQWEAMRWAKQQGCLSYDLWGVPDEEHDRLENDFTRRQDGLWGVYRFKRGFGGELKRSCGPWDRVYNPALYLLYTLRTRLRGG